MTAPAPSTERTATGLLKVPEVLVWFWVIKIVTTAMGEAVSDYLVGRFPPVPVVMVGAVGFAAALVWQFRTPRYRAWAAIQASQASRPPPCSAEMGRTWIR